MNLAQAFDLAWQWSQQLVRDDMSSRQKSHDADDDKMVDEEDSLREFLDLDLPASDSDRSIDQLLFQWELAELEYACGASLDLVSFLHWDQDSHHPLDHQVKHAMFRRGFVGSFIFFSCGELTHFSVRFRLPPFCSLSLQISTFDSII